MCQYVVNHHLKKANMNHCNKAGLTALTLASKLGRSDIFREIIKLQRQVCRIDCDEQILQVLLS